MPLTILSVGYPLAAITESTVGGAEQILAALDAGIVAAGHRSVVIAPAGSETSGLLLPTAPLPERLTDEVHDRACREYRLLIERALHEYSVDVVHLHGVD